MKLRSACGTDRPRLGQKHPDFIDPATRLQRHTRVSSFFLDKPFAAVDNADRSSSRRHIVVAQVLCWDLIVDGALVSRTAHVIAMKTISR
jgi:hypothetical protein